LFLLLLDSEAFGLLKKSVQAEDEILANFGGIVGLSSLLVVPVLAVLTLVLS
jgi:hypothetical protein